MIRRIIVAASVLFIGVGFLALSQPQIVSAQASLACDGLSPNEDGGDCTSEPTNAPSVNGVLEDVLNLLSLLAGGVAILMIIIAGTKFVTSQGDAGKVASARTTVVYAVIGLLIAAFAQTIIFFALNESVNQDPTEPTRVQCPRGESCPQ